MRSPPASVAVGLPIGARDPSIPAKDLAALSAASANVRVFVDKSTAHIEETARRGVPAETLLDVREIHEAIDVIGDLFTSYTKRLTAVEWAFIEPVPRPDWKTIFGAVDPA